MRRVSYRLRVCLANLGVLGIFMGAGLLLRFPPADNRFYPRCLFFSTFHLECPGCGGTRALAALLSGHLNQALHLNAMVVVLSPFLAALLAVSYYRAMQAQEFSWPRIPSSWLALTATVVILFSIARDIQPLWK